ncbi:MAG: hypothetical protein AB6733_08810 [Clostridiaceae bacterium]
MINSIRAFIFHLIYSFLIFIFSIWFVSTGPTLGKYTTSIPFRVLFITLFILGYIFGGVFLSSKKDRKYDLFFGIIITLVGIALWLYTFHQTGSNINIIPLQYSGYWILFNVFFAPFTMIYFFLDISVTPLLLIFTTVLPSILIGMGVKFNRMLKNRSVRVNC